MPEIETRVRGPVELVIDRPASGLEFRASEVNRAYESTETFWAQYVGSITFRKRQDEALLRAADLVANQTFKHFRDVTVNKNTGMEPVLVRAMMRHQSPSAARYWDAEALLELAHNIADGKILAEIPDPTE